MSITDESVHAEQPESTEAAAPERPGLAAQTAAMKQIAAILEAWMHRERVTTERAAEILGTRPSRVRHLCEGCFDELSLDELAEMLGHACAAGYRDRS